MSVEASLKQFLHTHVLPGSTLILGVSGGRDSMALLNAVVAICQENEEWLYQTVVVHVHHGLRVQADSDADFVEAHCLARGIPCHIVHVQVDRSTGEGIESAARMARYQAFVDRARQYNAPVLLLAHHQDDQIETFLMRWLRGTGTGGLAAMHVVSRYGGIPVMRPFLELSRDEITSYVGESQVTYVDDETNDDISFRRNYLRHEVLPLLRAVQPNLGGVTTRLTVQLEADDDYLNTAAAKALEPLIVSKSDEYIAVRLNSFRGIHRSLQRRMIHILLSCFASHGWSFQHIEAILGLSDNQSTSSASTSLRQGVSAWRSYELLYIGYDKGFVSTSVCHRWKLANEVHQQFQTGSMKWRFRRVHVSDVVTWKRRISLHAILLPDVPEVTVRTGCRTDVRVRPLGLGGSRKLQDVFTDRKIPRHLRQHWPIFCVDDEIVWMPGLVRSQAYTMSDESSAGWIIVGHVDSASRHEIGTLSWDTRRIIRE